MPAVGDVATSPAARDLAGRQRRNADRSRGWRAMEP